MATYMLFRIEGNFLTITNDDTGDVSNFPLSLTSYEIFIPQQQDSTSPDNKTYLFLTNLDGSKRKTGGWDILSEGCNYILYNLDTEVEFTNLTDLRTYLNSNLATPNRAPYRSYTALLTQSGGDNILYQNDGSLFIGVTYVINDNGQTGDWTNVGAPNNNTGTQFTATGTTPNSWGVNSELQYNSGAPVVTVLENTIDDQIYWTYYGEGTYIGHSDRGFFNGDVGIVFGQTNTNIAITKMYCPSKGEVWIEVFSDKDVYSNDLLNNTIIEIKAYN